MYDDEGTTTNMPQSYHLGRQDYGRLNGPVEQPIELIDLNRVDRVTFDREPFQQINQHRRFEAPLAAVVEGHASMVRR